MSLNNLISELSDSIKNFGISKNKKIFDDELEVLCLKLNNSGIEDDHDNWEIFKTNYSKLKYLYELITFYEISKDKKFMESFILFMESIDKVTQYYLENIIWVNSEFKDCLIIHDYMCESLNNNDCIKKIELIVNAYSKLMPIVEHIRNEPYNNELPPDDFIDTFEPSRKRLKY
jgi:hypothetical protein